MDLDDIWDEPIAPSPARPTQTEHATPSRSSPIKRRRTTLFLSSDSEGENASKDKPTYRARTPKKVPKDIEALFDDLDDDAGDEGLGDLAPALDLDQLRKQADARHAKHRPGSQHQVLPSSSPPRDIDDADGIGGKKGKDDDEPEGKKKRKPVARLDEARLLGRDGFPALVKQAKNFKPRGKGHEVSDLNRLLQMYQFWAHKMYPKTPFNDSVQRIEKLCHTKRMHNMVGVWRDEEKGLINGQNAADLQSPDEDDSDSDGENASDKEGGAPARERAQSSGTEDVAPEPRSAASSPPPRPPSSASEFTSGAPDDDFDIDGMLREEEEARLAAASQPKASSGSSSAPPLSYLPPVDNDDDQAMWDELDVLEDSVPAPAKSGPSNTSQAHADNMDEDEDMWDLVRELEQEQAQAQPATKPADVAGQFQAAATPTVANDGSEASATQGQPVSEATNDEGWDEMYL